MSNSSLRIFLGLGLLALIGVVVVQSYWFKKAFDTQSEDTDRRIRLALRRANEQIHAYNQTPVTILEPVERVSPNYYMVRVNDVIQPDLLEGLLIRHLKEQHINLDFEYGLYDCNTGHVKYGKYVCIGDGCESNGEHDFSELANDNSNFGVFFPHMEAGLSGDSGVWLFSSAAVLVVCMLFGYSLVVILRQKRLSELRQDFVNNLAHEFKTPLSAILAAGEVLQQPQAAQSPERLRQYASLIRLEALRLKHHVESILSSARDTHSMALRLSVTDLNSLVLESVDRFESSHPHWAGRVVVENPSESVKVLADPIHLSNAITNILDNADRHGKPNSIMVRTGTQRLWWRNFATVSIIDDGIGIAPNHVRHIFGKFYRVPSTQVNTEKGFGLGLYYVKSVMEKHGGKVTVQSSPGKGCCFTMYMTRLGV